MKSSLIQKISAILLTGGEHSGKRTAEILNADGTPLCSLPPLPDDKRYHIQSGLIACGGLTGKPNQINQIKSKSCLTFKKGVWTKTHNLGKTWNWHSSWTSDKHGTILLGGTYTKKSAERLTDDGKTKSVFKLKNVLE